jgi:hypothetical protein
MVWGDVVNNVGEVTMTPAMHEPFSACIMAGTIERKVGEFASWPVITGSVIMSGRSL